MKVIAFFRKMKQQCADAESESTKRTRCSRGRGHCLPRRLQTSDVQDLSLFQAYEIHSPNCGRDHDGVFHCVCGQCKPLIAKVSEDGKDGGNDCCKSR